MTPAPLSPAALEDLLARVGMPYNLAWVVCGIHLGTKPSIFYRMAAQNFRHAQHQARAWRDAHVHRAVIWSDTPHPYEHDVLKLGPYEMLPSESTISEYATALEAARAPQSAVEPVDDLQAMAEANVRSRALQRHLSDQQTPR